jgi:hypothetical protein
MNNQITLIALTLIALTFSGCLMPYESDYTCAYSEGYGNCLGARDNYELSQMSESERSQALNKQTGQSGESSIDCAKARQICSCADETNCLFDFEKLQYLASYGCLTPSEAIALSNHESLRYLSRLVLDRRAIETRTPNDVRSASNALGDVNDQSVIVDAEGAAENANPNTIGVVCGFPQVSQGSTIRIEVNRAWLRSEPNPEYPPANAIEAKRGDRFIVSEGWQTDSCGWLKLNNSRYVHQSIVKVVQ